MKKIIAEAEYTAEQLNKITALSEECGLCQETVSILYGRGIDTADKINGFIHPGRSRFLSPFLMSGMKEAVELITRARDEEWSVAIYGDYDADGICASTILCRALSDFGIQATVYVPERINGYGLNVRSIDEIFEEYFPQLFITVDCGISNAQEVEYIKEQGAEVIVTDHHELPDVLPDCICVNPKFKDDYPYDNLCGAGVAFKLGCALNGKDAYKYVDLAAIATVADSVPLTGENRDIVAEGLKLINASPRKNYAEFLKKDERTTSQSVAFQIAPKINAAGRMGNARAALSLFLSDDDGEIYDYSVRLTSYNIERQKYCDELYLSAKQMLKEKGANGRIILLCAEKWNAGFVGIVAARLAEEYCRPAMLFVKHGDSYKGSARSIDGVNIFEALKACDSLIDEFGGHSQAAGVNVSGENLTALEEALNKYLHENYAADAFTPTHYINGSCAAPMSQKFINELNLLEPFGVGNRKPLFVAEAESCKIKRLKDGTPHLSVKCCGQEFIFFSGLKYSKLLRSAMHKRLIFEFNSSWFRGKEQTKSYLRDVIYTADGVGGASDGIALNAVQLAAGQKSECAVEYVTREEAQRALSECEEYGTLFIAYQPSTLEQFDCGDREVNVFTPSAANLASIILLSPAADCELSGYEKVIFLDDPADITIASLSDKKVYVCKDIDGRAQLGRLSTQRDDLLSVFKILSANAYGISGDSSEEAAQLNDFGVPAAQAYFALRVFEELGLISFFGGRLTVKRGVKTQLNNSDLYNFIAGITQ